MRKLKVLIQRNQNIAIRALGVFFLTLASLTCIFLSLLLLETTQTFETALWSVPDAAEPAVEPFPVGVDPARQTITEREGVSSYLKTHFAGDFERTHTVTWLDRLYRQVAALPWYQSLASPSSRILVIYAGERKEEVVDNFGDILRWSDEERQRFADLVTNAPVALPDGTFFPGKYVTTVDATPTAVAALVQERFNKNVLVRYPEAVASQIPLTDTLTIASLIEREAYSFSDMRDISGVIWNRLFTDMNLQLDATLQYARGSRSWEAVWWPVPVPRDKFIDSPFNTYANQGLPPSPIANPSAAAILAALNPTKTDCFYYFHDRAGQMHCSATYEAHKTKLGR